MDLKTIIENGAQIIEIPEGFINNQLRSRGMQDINVTCNDGHLVLNAAKMEAIFRYHSSLFTNDEMTITLKLFKVKPFYYGIGLRFMDGKYPFLEYYKNYDGEKLITCRLDKIPGIDSALVEHGLHLRRLNINSVECKRGRVVIDLDIKPV